MPDAAVLDRVYAAIQDRRTANPETSHTARLFAKGTPAIAKKVGEEAVEAVIAGAAGDRAALIHESADVLFHMMVLWAAVGVAPGDVFAELQRREGTSGIAEKNARAEG